MALPTRAQALALVWDQLQSAYLRRHSLATEAVMRALASRLGADAELWGITGLVHDLDLERVGDDMHRHGHETVQLLRELYDYPAEGLAAILAHNGDVLGIACTSALDHALTAAESVTGLVFATSLILPSRQLQDVRGRSVLKRMKEPRFAAKVSRERVGHYRDLGLGDIEFADLAVRAMQSIAPTLEQVTGAQRES